MKLSTAIQLCVALGFIKVTNAVVAEWGQCGGMNWTDTTCVAGTTCVYSNPWYSQCIKSTNAPTTNVPATTSTTSSTTSTTTSTSTVQSTIITDGTPWSTTSTSTTTTTTSSTPTTVPSSCATPSTISGYTNAKLPNPFLFNDGTAVKTKADWTCRRAQISALIQGYEAGVLPPKPSSVTATYSGGTLAITVGNGGSTISFSVKITYPSGTAPSGGWPLVIAYDGGSIPIPAGIATLNYPCGTIAQQNDQSSRGVGLFYNLYGKSHTASAMTAWVWGVSRVIDALEITPAAKINVSKLAVTGCSRNGKGALMAGAFETRIALTIPQESGSGGDACWRMSKYEETKGSKVQTATEIVGENVWFSTAFNNVVNNLNSLPYDHHFLAAMVAPRALISYENTDYIWLSNMASYGCMSATRTVFAALGVSQNHGFEQVGGHSHCAWPSSLTPTLNAFFNKFLLGQSVSTDMWSTNNNFNGVTYTPADWINWTTPTLT